MDQLRHKALANNQTRYTGMAEDRLLCTEVSATLV
jgi:hypothetical protein